MIVAGFCVFYLLILVGYHLVIFFCCRTLSRTLHECHPDNRRMQPGLTYLNLIPCFNHVWCFVTVIQVAASLQAEYDDRRLDEVESDYGRTLGLAFSALWLLGSVVPNIAGALAPNEAMVVIGVALLCLGGTLVTFILYWVRIAGYGRQLANDTDEHGELADDEDDYDEPETRAPTDRTPPLPPVDPPHDPPR